MKQLFVFLASVFVAGVFILSSRVVTTRFPADWSVYLMAALGGLLLYGFVRSAIAFDRKMRKERSGSEPLPLIDSSTDTSYCEAMEELEGDNLHKATWAKALSESRGGLKAAEALYIKLRARHLAEKRKARRFRGKLVVSVFLVILLTFAAWTASRAATG